MLFDLGNNGDLNLDVKNIKLSTRKEYLWFIGNPRDCNNML